MKIKLIQRIKFAGNIDLILYHKLEFLQNKFCGNPDVEKKRIRAAAIVKLVV